MLFDILALTVVSPKSALREDGWLDRAFTSRWADFTALPREGSPRRVAWPRLLMLLPCMMLRDGFDPLFFCIYMRIRREFSAKIRLDF